MTKKTLILGNLILIFLLLYWFNFSQEKPVIKEQKEITIFTLDPLITIHAKMISGNNDEIKNTSNKKLTKLDIAHVESADIVFGGKTFETSSLQKIEKYRNHYVTIPLIVESPNSTYSLIELQTQIETIRDALAEKNPDRR